MSLPCDVRNCVHLDYMLRVRVMVDKCSSLYFVVYRCHKYMLSANFPCGKINMQSVHVLDVYEQNKLAAQSNLGLHHDL